MKTFSLALRNLLRNRRRSLTTLSAMVIGLVAILVFGGYKSNISYGSLTGFVQGTGHLQIQHKDYFLEGGDNPSAYGIADYERIIATVKRDPVLAPMLEVVTPTLQLGGIAGNFAAGTSRSVIASGVVAEEFNRMLSWNEYGVVSYAQPLAIAGKNQDTVVIGTGVARKLKLCSVLAVENCDQAQGKSAATNESAQQVPQDIAALSSLEQANLPRQNDTRIEMLAATARGAPNVASLNVVKAKNMGIKALDDAYLAMHLAQAQRLVYGREKPQVTAVAIQLKRTAQMPAAKLRLSELLATEFKNEPLTVLDFKTLNPMYMQTMQFMDSMFGFIATLIGVIVLFTIGNTMSTAVVERTVEIGTLRAIGLRRSGIRRLFLCEGVVLGVLGAIVGVIAASIIAYLINRSGLTWTPPGYSYAYLILIRIWQDMNLLIGSVIGLFAVAVISSWWPANRASKMMIVDALRHV
ncbi:MAG: ABC transporter permease [Burkholderiales bacterium]|nr:ABC transporter permease [Burkholderiales bacterium]